MALVLTNGNSLPVNTPVSDETQRFFVVLESDGNLVVYGHLTSPAIATAKVGATGTNLGNNCHLYLSPFGDLLIVDASGNGHALSSAPTGIGIGWPLSELHIQADGNLVHYSQGTSNPVWSTGPYGGLQRNVVPPGVLVISVDGQIAPNGDKTIQNGQGGPIAVRDANNIVVLAPGASTQVNTGSLSIPYQLTTKSAVYEFTNNTENAGPAQVYGPGNNNITIT